MKVIDPASQMRRARIDSLLDCKYSKNNALQKSQEVARAHARFNLVKSDTGIKTIFGDHVGEAVQNKIAEYIKFDEKHENVCDPNAPGDKAWLDYIKAIASIMQASIDQDKNDLKKIDQ